MFSALEDANVKKLLWCLKALSFKSRDDIPGTFIKIESFYRRYCAVYDKLTTQFEELFLKKLNLDYWNTNYLLSEARDRRSQYLELNKRLEVHDLLTEKYLDNAENFKSFCDGLVGLEAKFKSMAEHGEQINVSYDDLDETCILSDLLDQKFFIEQVMSHSFQMT